MFVFQALIDGLANLTFFGWLRLALDLYLSWIVIYLLINLIKLNVRTLQILKGVFFVLIINFISHHLGLTALSTLVRQIMQWGVLAILIIFQPEIRSALEQIGINAVKGVEEASDTLIDTLCDAIDFLSKRHIGALIVLEQDVKLDEFLLSATMMESSVSSELITTLFVPTTPLHDGAVIIRDEKIHCAGAYLPLTTRENIDTELGTRHRAAVGATFFRDVKPGEVLQITKDGLHEDFYAKKTSHNMCSMEYIYFARPDSDIEGINIHEARKRCGAVLAQEQPAPTADIVIGVPDSGLSAAIGYAEESGLPFETGMIKNRYIGRTFIEPSQELREQGVKMKLSVVGRVVKGKSVVLIDDSIVRGTTSRNLVTMLKNAGAREVHMRIAAPEIKYPCFYGVDFATKDQLISARMSVEELCKQIGANSLGFMSVAGMTKGVGRRPELGKDCGQCTACFTGEYQTYLYEKTEEMNKEIK